MTISERLADHFVGLRPDDLPPKLIDDAKTLVLDYPWVSGQPYTVSMLTSTGLVAVALAAVGYLAVAWAGFAAWALIGLTVLVLGARTGGDNAATIE